MCLVLKLDNGIVVSIANGQNHRRTYHPIRYKYIDKPRSTKDQAPKVETCQDLPVASRYVANATWTHIYLKQDDSYYRHGRHARIFGEWSFQIILDSFETIVGSIFFQLTLCAKSYLQIRSDVSKKKVGYQLPDSKKKVLQIFVN